MSAVLAFGEADGKGAEAARLHRSRPWRCERFCCPFCMNMLKCGRRIGAVRMLSTAKAASPTKRAMAEQRLKEAVVDGLVKERVIPVPKTPLALCSVAPRKAAAYKCKHQESCVPPAICSHS